MKTITLLLVLAFCLTFIGCGVVYGPVEEVKAFINEKDDVILQISKKIEANQTEAGVDEARKIFEARKDGLEAKKAAFKNKSLEVYSNCLAMLLESEVNDTEHFKALYGKIIENGSFNDVASKKFWH